MNYFNTSQRNFLTSTLLAGFMVGPEAASGRKNRILVLGASGLTGGAIASTLDRGPADIEVVRAARKKEQVEAWKREGKQAVYLDLDDARTFPAALEGIDRLFLLTGYTIAMLHQSKTLVDAAADSGVSFIVHQGIFGNGRSTDPHFAWHEMVERYIEGSGVAWAHLHPHFFMQNILTTLGLPNGQLRWPMGDKRVGWIAGEDLAAVAATVLADGPAAHAGQNYFLSTEVLNGVEAATILSEALGRQIAPVVMTPSDLMAAFASGAAKSPAGMEENYAKSQLEWAHQSFDGRMDYSIVATSTVQDLLGRPALTLREWAPRHREALLAAASK
jgi:NAD(P)H dehydrogenase (quinone)